MKKNKNKKIFEKPAPPTIEKPIMNVESATQPLDVSQSTMRGSGQVPIYSPTGPVQLTPIIQPIAFVPYSTQEQPLYMYDDYDQDYYDDGYGYADEGTASYDTRYRGEYGQAQPEIADKKRVSATAIILILLSLLSIAVFVVGKFLDLTFIQVANDSSGLDMLLNFFALEEIVFDGTTVVTLGIALAVACSVLILLASVVRIKLKGACIFAKIFSFIGLVAALLAVLVSMVQKETITINYGMYAIAIIALLQVLFAFLAKNKR